MAKKLTKKEIYEKSDLYDPNMEYKKECDVLSGNWVLIIRTVPVVECARPQLYGIYWGVPTKDPYGRQVCKIRTTDDVTLLNHEFTVISEEKLQLYREEGWELHETNYKVDTPLNMELIEKGRALCEEEREIIWALQLDGLNECQACEEYFLSKHTDYSNYTICYLPSASILAELELTFGQR